MATTVRVDIDIRLLIPHERVLNSGFSDVMREATLQPDGSVQLDHESFGAGFERGTVIGHWELVTSDE